LVEKAGDFEVIVLRGFVQRQNVKKAVWHWHCHRHGEPTQYRHVFTVVKTKKPEGTT